MALRRQAVRALAVGTWRAGRIRLQRDLEALSNGGLEAWTPSTITRQRLREVTHDDYAYGSLTDFERAQLRQVFDLEKLRGLTVNQKRALGQAARNEGWTDEIAWHVEVAGREVLTSAGAGEWHYVQPSDPAFWVEVWRGIDS